MSELSTYPIRLHMHGRDVLVVGAGKVATRKIQRLLESGARVRVIAPFASERIHELAQRGTIDFEARAASPTDAQNVFMVIAATDDPQLNRGLVQHSRLKGILTLSVDDPESCDFSVPASVNGLAIEATISTRGKAPAASRRLQRELATWLDRGPERFVLEMAKARKQLRDVAGGSERLRALADGQLYDACVRNDEAQILALTSALGSEP